MTNVDVARLRSEFTGPHELFTQQAAKEFCEGIHSGDREFFVVRGAKHAFFPRDGLAPLAS